MDYIVLFGVINRADCNVNAITKLQPNLACSVINRADCNVNSGLIGISPNSRSVINRADCNVNVAKNWEAV